MTKTVCDRCGREITSRVVVLQFGSRLVYKDEMDLQGTSWDLCDPCKRDVERLLREAPPRPAKAAEGQ